MPNIVYDQLKGFCYSREDESRTLRPRGVTITSGFDMIPWDDLVPPILIPQSLNEVEIDRVDDRRKKSKQEKKQERQQKKINVARKKKLERQMVESKEQEFNPIIIEGQIQKLYNKILKMANISKDKDLKLFQYHSIAVYKSDVDYLLPGEWLNDNDISLIYEMLTQLIVNNLEIKFGKQVQLLYPTLVQLFLHYPNSDDIESILPIDDLKSLKFIFIPINFIDDYDQVDLEDANQGDHWALAIFSVLESRIYLYDSMSLDDDSDSDKKLLQELTKRIISCKNIVKTNKIECFRMKCDQQMNFDDCGVYVLMITCFMMKRLLLDQDGTKINMDISNIKYNPLLARYTMIDLVHRLYTLNVQ